MIINKRENLVHLEKVSTFAPMLRKVASILLLIMVSLVSHANDSICIEYPDTLFNDTISVEKEGINWKRLGLHTTVFVGAGATMLIILEALPENATAWNKSEIQSIPLFRRYSDHIKKGPVFDRDNPTFNYILHPYAGAVYYQAARGSGCNMWQSFLYSTFVSNVLWEYGIEAFNETPSIQDLVITPVIGSAIGEGFHICKKKIVSNDYRVLGKRWIGKTICWMIDPFNEFANIFMSRKDTLTSSVMVTRNAAILSVNVTF